MVALLLRFTKEKTSDGSHSTHHVLLRVPVDKDLEDTVQDGWNLEDVDVWRV